jgi:hypothetical protein
MPVTAGSVWVQGQYLHFSPTTTTNYRYLGTFVANRSAGVVGSIWIDGQNLRYLDNNKDERVLPLGSVSSPAGVSSAINGSVWIENVRLNSIEGTVKQKREYHSDVSFADTSFGNTHTDIPFSSAHTDQSHVDFYSDSHSDQLIIEGPTGPYPYSDSHNDSHADVDYSDSHFDQFYSDAHGDASHADTPHSDQPEFVGNV